MKKKNKIINDKSMTIPIDKDTKQYLIDWAESEGRTTAALVRIILKDAIKEYKV